MNFHFVDWFERNYMTSSFRIRYLFPKNLQSFIVNQPTHHVIEDSDENSDH